VSRLLRTDPLLYAVPLALAFAPFIWYASGVLGWPGGWLSTRVALVLCIGVFLAHRLAAGDFTWRPVPGAAYALPYVALVLLSVLWAAFGSGSTEIRDLGNELVTWVIPVGLALLLAVSRRTADDLAVVGRVLLFIVFVTGVLSAFQVLLFTGRGHLVPGTMTTLARHVAEETWFGSFRVYGTFPHIGPNMFGIFILIPTVILLSRTAGAAGWRRWIWVLGGVVGAGIIGFTLSRGAQLGLVVALVALPLWRRSWRGALAVLALGAIGFAVVVGTAVWGNVLRLVAGGQLDPGAQERLHIWTAIVREAPAHPLGFGFNGWPRVSGSLIEAGIAQGANTVGSRYPAENQWLRELADRGLLGVLALALLFGGLLLVTFRFCRDAPRGWPRDFMAGAGAGLAGFAVAMMTGDQLMYESVAGMFWFTAALVVGTAASLGSVAPAMAADRSPDAGTRV
jgi:O-antigen ligase